MRDIEHASPIYSVQVGGGGKDWRKWGRLRIKRVQVIEVYAWSELWSPLSTSME